MNIEIENEVDTIGLGYQKRNYTKEDILNRYDIMTMGLIEEGSPDSLDILNNYNHSFYVKNFNKIPMGLEKKISLGFFQHFFNWDKMNSFQVEPFRGNWLDVPFPYAKTICMHNHIIDSTLELKDDCYNWYELFLIMNDMMFRQGRLLDIGITSISFDNKIITLDWSS